MIRYLAAFVLFFALAGAAPTSAQVQPGVAAAAAPAQKPVANTPSPAEIKELTRTLNDPDARAKLIRQLELLGAGQAAEDSAHESSAAGSRTLRFISARVAEAGDEFEALGRAFVGLPAAGRWFMHQMQDPTTRAHWVQLGTSLFLVLAAGAAALWLTELAVGRPRRSIERHATTGVFGRVGLALLRLMLQLIPIVLFGAVSYSLLPAFNPPANVNVAAITLINATVLVLVIVAGSTFFLAPNVPALRLVLVNGRTANFLHHWLCSIGAVLAFGWFGITAARLLGLPLVASQAAFKIVGTAVLVMLISVILQARRAVAAWIRGESPDAGDAAARVGAAAFWSTRGRLADIWHLLAVAYLIVIFGIWVFDLKGGFDFVARGTLISILVMLLARLVDIGFEELISRGVALSHQTKSRFPHLQQRADHYVPIVHGSFSVVVWLIAILGLLKIWGVNSFGWFDSADGRAILARSLSIIFVIAGATIAWELVSALIERYLLGAAHNGSPVERSQRVRTLLPLLRNAFLIFLIVVVVLLVLSEIGLNIAPLLAGAGVVGLAIGFGAQTLVKDVITGVFILFENTIAVGDVVDVGGGHSGLVESFSVRTIKLRDNAGGVHTVPFSNVTSVVNMTKDYAFYVFNIKVDYGQDTDRVVEQVRALGAEMQADPAFCDFILAPIEVIGVDSFGPDAVVLQARIKTRPLRQWSVGREFNRRLKKRFDGMKIPLAFPQSVIVLPDPSKTIQPSESVPAGPVVGE